MLYFHFRGAGWLFPFYFGVAQYIKEHFNVHADNIKVGGVSAGAVTSLLLLLECDLHEIYVKTLERYNEAKYNPFKMKECLDDILIKYIPNDDEMIKKYCDKLLIGLSKIDFGKMIFQPHIMKEYRCKSTCIDIIRASCHIPLISGISPYYINGQGYFDGDMAKMPEDEFTNGMKIDIDIRSGTNKICPGIVLPEIWCYYPADPFVLKSLYQLGYLRANQFVYENSSLLQPFMTKQCFPCDNYSVKHLQEIIQYGKQYTDICAVRSPLRTLLHVFPKRTFLISFALWVLFKWRFTWIKVFVRSILARYRGKKKHLA
jgi:hypothetical protein